MSSQFERGEWLVVIGRIIALLGMLAFFGEYNFSKADDLRGLDPATIVSLLSPKSTSLEGDVGDQVHKWQRRTIHVALLSNGDESDLEAILGEFGSLMQKTQANIRFEERDELSTADVIIFRSSRMSDILTQFDTPVSSLILPVASATGRSMETTVKDFVQNYNGGCDTIISLTGVGYEIGKAFVFVSSELDSQLARKCLLSKLSAAMGLKNGFVSGASVISTDAAYLGLTPNDVMALNLLYLSKIAPGDRIDHLIRVQDLMNFDSQY
jgi:hypothetical protein